MILREAFSGWLEDQALFDLFDSPPWKDDIESSQLNLMYFGNHSGAKRVSPLVTLVLSGDALSPEERNILAKAIQAKYKQNWLRLWQVTNDDYNPVHNYNMEETIVRNTKEHVADESSSTRTPNLTDTTTHGKTRNEMDYRYGFNTNADSPQPSDKITTTDGGTTKVAQTGTEKNDSSGSKDGTEDETITTRRFGNIGVTTSQKMVTEERMLWLWNYFDQVFSDIDKVLATPFYDPCKIED